MPSNTPAERLRAYGVETLSDHDLVALLLGKHGQDWLGEGLLRLAQHAGAPARIQAAFELGRRLQRLPGPREAQITEARMLAEPLMARYLGEAQEHFGAVFLDARNRLLRERELYVGTVNSTTGSPREIFKYALDLNASSVIIYHNHPSGDPSPSVEDRAYTEHVVAAGQLLRIPVLDHLVLGRQSFYSFREHGHVGPPMPF